MNIEQPPPVPVPDASPALGPAAGSDRYQAHILLCRLQDLLAWVEVAAKFKYLTDSEQIHLTRLAKKMRNIYGESRGNSVAALADVKQPRMGVMK